MADAGSLPPPLTAEDAQAILRKLEPELATGELVLIGGQAVLFWQEFFGQPGSTNAVETSADIDLAATNRDVVSRCAELLGGRACFPNNSFDPTSLGLIQFADEHGHNRQLDVVRAPIGLRIEDVLHTAQPFVRTDDAGDVIRLFVLHPERMLEGRVAGLATGLRTDAIALAQLHSAIESCRAFLTWIIENGELDLSERERIRTVLRLNKRIFQLAWDWNGLEVWIRYGIDVTEAALTDHPRLPERYGADDLPLRQTRLASRRERRARGRPETEDNPR